MMMALLVIQLRDGKLLIDQITGGSGGAAPTRTVNAIEEKQDDILDGTATFTGVVGVNGIIGGGVSIFANKTPPQEMCHTWNINGKLDVFYGGALGVDGHLMLPFDAEITGFSCSIHSMGDQSAHLVVDIFERADIIGSTDFSCFDNKIILEDDVDPNGMWASYINITTGAVDYTDAIATNAGGVRDRKTASSVFPEWQSGRLSIAAGNKYLMKIISGPVGAENFSLTLFFRRTEL